MNEKALQALEYPRIKEMLVERTVSESGRKLAEKHGPSADERRIHAMLAETEEAQKLLQSGQVYHYPLWREWRRLSPCWARELFSQRRIYLTLLLGSWLLHK